ncbi:MAG: GNAT family N-acetyltransferase [Gammaproteobacteria bacterium]|nr:MAG: GNAT family N-acetyltransferase [Gammaproteobacteria bacterium]
MTQGNLNNGAYEIRDADADEYGAIGRLTVDVFQQLPDMPGPDKMPEFYAMLQDVGTRAANPATNILVAVDSRRRLLGAVTFVGDMKFYGVDGSESWRSGASGFRHLVVDVEARGCGLGRALTNKCIQKARRAGSSHLIVHTTKAMQTAWQLYDRMGFQHSVDLDFCQGNLPVYGFHLPLRQEQSTTPLISSHAR